MKKLLTFTFMIVFFCLSGNNIYSQEDKEMAAPDVNGTRYELTREYFLNAYGRSDDVNIVFPQIMTSQFPFIQFLASITDENGEPIAGLNETNFSITENQIPVTSFTVTQQAGSSSQQAAVALVIDISGSMGSSGLNYAKQAAIQFVNNMLPNDRAAIVVFGTNASVLLSMTSDKNALISTINSISLAGMTALFDGFYLGLQECEPEPGVRAVVGFTDGKNNSSSFANLTTVINYANQIGVPIYCIGVTSSINETLLQNMANSTGGSYYYAPDQSGIGDIYDEISENIASQYRIVFTTPSPSMDGTDREVQVNVTLD